MASIEEILGKQINSIKELRAEIKNLQDSLIGVDADSEQFKTTSQQLAAAQEELTKVTRAGKEENVAAKDSIVGMKNEYKALYDQYKLLSDEQRNSDFGKNMAASLETLSSKINETQKGVGSFKDNIGNYAASVSEAFNKMGVSVGGLQGPFKAAQVASGGLNTAFKTLAANPIMLAITAIVAILAKAAAAIKNNEQLTMRLQQALSVFKPVLDAVSNAFDFLAGIIVKVVEGFAKVSEKVLSIIPGYKKAAQSHKELTKATNDLIKSQREAAELNAKRQGEVEDLRARAAAATDNAEKLQLLEEAKAKQAEIDQTNLELAQEDLRIKEALAEKTANDTQAEEELAAARKKVGDLTAQASRHEKEYNEQIKTTTQAINNQTNSINKSTVATKNYREEAKKLYEQTVENNKDEITKLTEKYEKEKKLLTKYGYDTTLLTKQYNAEIYKINKEAEDKNREERLKALAQHKADIDKEIELHRRQGKEVLAIEQEIELLTNKSDDISNKGALDRVADIEEKVNDIVESLKDYSKGSLDEILEKAKEWEDFINDNTFEALGDEYKDLKDAIAEVNSKFGLSITTVDNLNLTYESLLQTLKELKGEHDIAEIAEELNAFDWTSIQEEMTMMEGGFKYGDILEERARNTREYLEEEKRLLQESLANWEGTTEQEIELTKRLYTVQEELLNKQREYQELNKDRFLEMMDSLIDMTDNMSSSLASYKSTRESVIDSEVKAGNISEKEGKRRKKNLLALERAERDFAVAAIAADAATGIVKIWRGWATETGEVNPVTAAGNAYYLAALNAKSTIAAVAKTAGLAATATAQIAAAKGKYVVAKNNMEAEESGGGSTGVAAAPMLIDSTPYSYTRTVQTQEEEDSINQRPIWVSVEDISSALGQQAQVREESSF